MILRNRSNSKRRLWESYRLEKRELCCLLFANNEGLTSATSSVFLCLSVCMYVSLPTPFYVFPPVFSLSFVPVRLSFSLNFSLSLCALSNLDLSVFYTGIQFILRTLLTLCWSVLTSSVSLPMFCILFDSLITAGYVLTAVPICFFVCYSMFHFFVVQFCFALFYSRRSLLVACWYPDISPRAFPSDFCPALIALYKLK